MLKESNKSIQSKTSVLFENKIIFFPTLHWSHGNNDTHKVTPVNLLWINTSLMFICSWLGQKTEQKFLKPVAVCLQHHLLQNTCLHVDQTDVVYLCQQLGQLCCLQSDAAGVLVEVCDPASLLMWVRGFLSATLAWRRKCSTILLHSTSPHSSTSTYHRTSPAGTVLLRWRAIKENSPSNKNRC